MSERKNIKRNKTRVSAKDRALHQSMQHNYKKIILVANNPTLFTVK